MPEGEPRPRRRVAAADARHCGSHIRRRIVARWLVAGTDAARWLPGVARVGLPGVSGNAWRRVPDASAAKTRLPRLELVVGLARAGSSAIHPTCGLAGWPRGCAVRRWRAAADRLVGALLALGGTVPFGRNAEPDPCSPGYCSR